MAPAAEDPSRSPAGGSAHAPAWGVPTPPPDDDEIVDNQGKPRLNGILRLLEVVMFCCLSALVLFWFADRLRSVDFEPIVVTPCEDAECMAYAGPPSGRPEAVFTEALEAGGVTSFSTTDICTQLADTLQLRGEQAEGVDLILDRITTRGTVTLTRPEDGTIVIGPGARNDGFGDALRDAFRIGPARGCHPINYKPVFWPLWTGWMLLVGLRLFRGRQAVWQRR